MSVTVKIYIKCDKFRVRVRWGRIADAPLQEFGDMVTRRTKRETIQSREDKCVCSCWCVGSSFVYLSICVRERINTASSPTGVFNSHSCSPMLRSGVPGSMSKVKYVTLASWTCDFGVIYK